MEQKAAEEQTIPTIIRLSPDIHSQAISIAVKQGFKILEDYLQWIVEPVVRLHSEEPASKQLESVW